ncbi:MAG: FliA/WhiG family RNA polymerase sigma factor [Planctomycetes bacterium]|nr:FliA/WhiG family RNA polymerase sigma factor [Planctomycetota bacterium]
MSPKKQRVGVKKKPAKAAKKPATDKRLEAIQPALPRKPAAAKPADKPTHDKPVAAKGTGMVAPKAPATKASGKGAKEPTESTAKASARKPDAKEPAASKSAVTNVESATSTGAKASMRTVQGVASASEPLLDVSAELALPPAPPPLTAAKVQALLKKGKRPEVDALKAMATEELWTLYRKAVRVKPVDADWIELLRNVLMELHYPLVKHIAERLLQTLPKSIELDDLVSAGLFGLMDAIRGFDPDRGIKFKTYCTTRIRGSILDQLRSQDWVPRLVRLKASKIEKALHKLQGEYGREPTHAELAAALEMEHGELANEITSSQAKTMFSLSERWDDRDDDSSVEKVEVLVDKNAIDPIHELNRRDVMNHITRSLTYKERFIIEQYYHVGHTMREIGEMLALTESRVCQIHSNVMARLQGLLNQRSESFHA